MEETKLILTNTTNNKRIFKNSMMLYIRMIITMIVSLYTSRVILNTLGIQDYGIFNIVGGVVSLFAIVNISMTTSSQRFLSFEIGSGNFFRLKNIFNALQLIHIGIALGVFILSESIGLWFVKNYLVIPPNRLSAALVVFHFSVLSSLITIIQVPYNATIIAHEKMNIYAYVSILEVSLKLVIVFLLNSITFDKLELYSILYFTVSFIIAAFYRYYVSKHFKESKFELVKDKNLYKVLINFSGWSLYGTMAAVVNLQGINILLNIFFGPMVNAARGIATQVQVSVNKFVSNFQTAVNPQIIKSYAATEYEYMTNLIIKTSKFSFYLLFLIILPVLLEVDLILNLWLKKVPEFTSIFTILVLILILIDCISAPLVTVIQATGKIKRHQVLVSALLILILPFSYYFLNKGYPPQITLYISIISYLFILILRLYIVRKLLNFPIWIFIKEVILKDILIILLSFSLPLLVQYFLNPSILRLLVVIFVSLIWSSVIIYSVGLHKSEKMIIIKSFKKKYDQIRLLILK